MSSLDLRVSVTLVFVRPHPIASLQVALSNFALKVQCPTDISSIVCFPENFSSKVTPSSMLPAVSFTGCAIFYKPIFPCLSFKYLPVHDKNIDGAATLYYLDAIHVSGSWFALS